jgi:hypothetical protein
LDSAAQVTYSGTFTVSALGSHTVTFHSVDVAGNVEGSKTVTFKIDNATATSLTSSLNPSVYNQSVTFTATVTSNAGTPVGGVTFYNGSTAIGGGALSAGKLAFSTSTLTAGSHSITAVFSSTGNWVGSTSPLVTQVVNKDTTSTKLTSSLNPARYGQSVTFTATVTSSSGTPVGGVTFMNGTTAIGGGALSGGKITLTKTTLPVGTLSITAVYSGTVNYATSTSPVLTEQINKAATTTSLTSSLNPSSLGTSVTFTAVVAAGSGTPAGSVTFKNGTTVLGVRALSAGKATLSTTSLTSGSHSITAVYSGGTNYAGSTSPVLTQVVGP